MKAIETDVCPKCFGEKKIETTPGVFKDCTECCDFVQINIRKVPSKLRGDFRIWCFDRELYMASAIISLMRYAIDNDLNIPKREK